MPVKLYCKFFGAILWLGGGIYLCWKRLRERRRVRDTLREITECLRQMREGIRLNRTPLPDLLAELGEGRSSPELQNFFRKTARGFHSKESPANIWRQELDMLPLSDAVKIILRELVDSLRGDETAVCANLLAAEKRLRREWETLERLRPEEEKRITCIYLSGTALLLIVLL